jgi:hypothetical protein
MKIYWVWEVTSAAPVHVGGHDNAVYGSGPKCLPGAGAYGAAGAYAEDDDRDQFTVMVMDPHTLERWSYDISKSVTVTPRDYVNGKPCPA